jgi:hypothetical protein
MEYFTAVFWVPHDIFSFLVELIEIEWGTKCDYYVWTKKGKFGKQGLWVSTVTEIAVVGYYSTSAKRLPCHFATQKAGTILSNHIDLPVVSNKSRTTNSSGATEIVNSTEMNVGVPMTIIKNHSNKGEWIADLYAGSGSGSVAGVVLGRHVVAADLRETQVCVFSLSLKMRFSSYVLLLSYISDFVREAPY